MKFLKSFVVRRVCSFITSHNIKSDLFEFFMLYIFIDVYYRFGVLKEEIECNECHNIRLTYLLAY